MSRKFEYISTVTNPDFDLPKRATAHSIAYDIYSPEDFTVKPGEKYMLWSNIKAQFNPDEALLVNVRSSMGKKNIMLANTQGWLESDYYNNADNEGNIGLMFYNYGTEEWKIQKNDRVAQAMFIKYCSFFVIRTIKMKGIKIYEKIKNNSPCISNVNSFRSSKCYRYCRMVHS